MTQYMTDITAVSSKGQVVLPKEIRDSMQIEPGTKLMVISDGVSIILKPIPKPLMEAASGWAAEVGMTEDDITAAIKKVRSRRRE